MIKPIEIIREFYHPATKGYAILVHHSRQVTRKALETAKRVPHLEPNLEFIAQAAMLHDIGIFMIDAALLGCNGHHPYLMHGTLGRQLLEEIDLPAHALVCERHVGVGISTEDIVAQALPLPVRDMRPDSIEEQIICFADKFFSKTGNGGSREKSIGVILKEIEAYGPGKVGQFESWLKIFQENSILDAGSSPA